MSSFLSDLIYCHLVTSIHQCIYQQTPDQYKYIPVKGFDASAGEVTFEVKARNDAHIALGEDNLHNGKKYEIVLGGWGNTQSVIRGRNQGSNLVTYRAVVLNNAEYTKFRLSWDKTMLKVERESGDSWTMIMKLSGRDKSPHNAYNWDIRYMMISTGWGATGDWRIGEPSPKPEIKLEVLVR